jgi:hypothetical protein
MPLKLAKLPPTVRKAVRSYLLRWKVGGGPDISFTEGAVRILQPLPLYRQVAGFEDGKINLESLDHSGWRCFLGHGADGLAALDVFLGPEGRYGFRLHVGAVAGDWLRHVRLVKKRKRLKEGVYELRALIAPAIHFSCLWLSTNGAGADLFVRIDEGAGEKKQRPWMTKAEVQSHIGNAAAVSGRLWEDARRKQLS